MGLGSAGTVSGGIWVLARPGFGGESGGPDSLF